jgi:DNA-binding LacI/PurR family transcriptional regulator
LAKLIKNVTSADVAERAGVSRRLVSMVLNNRGEGQVSAATRQRIEAVAAEMRYRRSAVAVSLQRQSTHTIGLVTDEIASRPLAGQLIKGATEAALEHDYMLLTLDVGHPGVDLRRSMTMLEERRVDGVVYATAGRSVIDVIDDATIPLVLANSSPLRPSPLSSFLPDDEGGARAAIARLADAGHRHISMLSGNEGVVAERERERGARAEARARKIRLDIVPAGWNMNDGHRAAMQVLGATDRPTALFCIRDRVAAGALQAAATLGLQVPQDLSIIGFDDEDGFAAMLVPGLTTIALPLATMGRLAMLHLLESIENPVDADASGDVIVLECPLVERESVTAPR